LADFLQRFPEAVNWFKTRDEQRLKAVPAALVSLIADPPDDLRSLMNHSSGPLDAKTIRECSGQ
jgi:hypothetical protein